MFDNKLFQSFVHGTLSCTSLIDGHSVKILLMSVVEMILPSQMSSYIVTSERIFNNIKTIDLMLKLLFFAYILQKCVQQCN